MSPTVEGRDKGERESVGFFNDSVEGEAVKDESVEGEREIVSFFNDSVEDDSVKGTTTGKLSASMWAK